MSRQIIVSDEARFDAIDIAYYIAEDSLPAADRFADAVDAAYERLAEMPGIGVPREYGNPRLAGMRMWPVPGFVKYLIFYRATETELRIVRVVQGSRDIASLFAPDDPDEPAA